MEEGEADVGKMGGGASSKVATGSRGSCPSIKESVRPQTRHAPLPANINPVPPNPTCQRKPCALKSYLTLPVPGTLDDAAVQLARIDTLQEECGGEGGVKEGHLARIDALQEEGGGEILPG